jgi:hypothetical protein
MSFFALADSPQVSMIDALFFDKLVSACFIVRGVALCSVLYHRNISLDKFEGAIDLSEGCR